MNDHDTSAPGAFLPRRVATFDGRAVTLRAIDPSDAPEIVQAFGRLSARSRYLRFMHPRQRLSDTEIERGVNPAPGSAFVLVATVPAEDGLDIVGAAQYVPADQRDRTECEFALTVAEDWRGCGLGTILMTALLDRARQDGYLTMQGTVMATNRPMLALARRLGFDASADPDDAAVVVVRRTLAAEAV